MDKTQLYNLALSAIGTRTTVSSPQENSVEAKQLNIHFEPALRSVLQSAHWNFARAQVALSLLADGSKQPPDPVPTPWLYSYALPPDHIQIRYIMPQFNNLPASVPGLNSIPMYVGPPIRFQLSNDLDGQGNERIIILTNQALAIGVYTKYVDNTALWDSSFTDALAHYLGSRVAVSLTGKTSIRDRVFAMANDMILQARASNGNESLTVNDVVPDWVRARGYNADWAYPPGSMVYYSPQNLTLVT